MVVVREVRCQAVGNFRQDKSQLTQATQAAGKKSTPLHPLNNTPLVNLHG